MLDQTTQPSCKGDAAGSAKGVKSGTVGGEVKPVKGSSTVRVGGKPIIRDGDPCTMNGGNCPGVFITTQAPSGSLQGGASTADTNPPVTPDTPEEQHFWSKASPWVHGVLGVASFVPGLSIVTGAADAAIYAAEGNAIEAGLAAASMIPGGKLVTTAGKAVNSAAKLTQGTKAVGNIAKATKATNEAVKLGANPKKVSKGKDGAKIKGRKKGPCDHLRKGNGKGEYRGGSHNETSKPANDGKDSHHMPADDASPLKKNDGPAIQMDPKDHARTSSNGNQGLKGVQYRAKIAAMLAEGKWREAMLEEIKDVRKIAKKSGNPRKYNEAMLEMQKYFKCLEQHGLLK